MSKIKVQVELDSEILMRAKLKAERKGENLEVLIQNFLSTLVEDPNDPN